MWRTAPDTVVPVTGPMDVADGLGVFMFMPAILPQEGLQVPIDNSVDPIDFLDEHALHRQAPPCPEAAALRRFVEGKRAWRIHCPSR